MSARPLSPEQCRLLLASTSIGRVVLTERALPSAQPVHYLLTSGGIVFPTESDGLLGRLLHAGAETVLGFESDDVDELFEFGWTVHVVGLAAALDRQESQRHDAVRLRTWTASEPSTLVRIPLTLVTGRAVGVPSPLRQFTDTDIPTVAQTETRTNRAGPLAWSWPVT